MCPAGSTRWCPTPEQLMILEEMYRSGVRTPNASQIQHITAHLSYYGKIEGKNVFYWFQNHKARERQKLRRKLGKQLHLHQHQQLFHHQLQQQQQQQVPATNHHHHQLPHCSLLQSPPLAPPPPCLASSLPFYHPLKVLPQGGGSEDGSTKMTSNNDAWKKGIQERVVEMEKSAMGLYGRDWMMMVDHHDDRVAPPASCCSKPPLKTLELFPITSANLKEECNVTSRQN